MMINNYYCLIILSFTDAHTTPRVYNNKVASASSVGGQASCPLSLHTIIIELRDTYNIEALIRTIATL